MVKITGSSFIQSFTYRAGCLKVTMAGGRSYRYYCPRAVWATLKGIVKAGGSAGQAYNSLVKGTLQTLPA